MYIVIFSISHRFHGHSYRDNGTFESAPSPPYNLWECDTASSIDPASYHNILHSVKGNTAFFRLVDKPSATATNLHMQKGVFAVS